MAGFRWVRRLCGAIVVLSAVEFVVATTGVQIQHLPARTDFASYYLAAELARAHRSPYAPSTRSRNAPWWSRRRTLAVTYARRIAGSSYATSSPAAASAVSVTTSVLAHGQCR